jgi:hypothetical protein
MVKLTCSGCAKPFELETNRFNDRIRNGSDGIFCTPQCQRDWQSEQTRKLRQPLIDAVKKRGNTKQCSLCKRNLPVELFPTGGSGLRNYCPQCFSKYTGRRYLAKKIALVEFMGGVCSKCGKPCHYSGFHFHHTDPQQKRFDWNRLRRRSIEEILKEIKKCVLICSLCHAKEHASTEVNDEVLRMKTAFLKQFQSGSANGPKLSKMKASWPSREELEKLVWKKPVSTIGKELGISAMSLSNRCKRLNIEVPGQGYWSKFHMAGCCQPTKANWPSDDRLRELVAQKPMTVIGCELGVSGNAVKKRCRKLGIQSKVRGRSTIGGASAS